MPLFESTLERSSSLIEPTEAVSGVVQRPIGELPFMDLLLRIDLYDPMQTLYKEPGQALGINKLEIVPEQFDDEVRAISSLLLNTTKPAGAFKREGIFYRYQKTVSADEGTWVNVRRFNAVTMRLEDLRMAPEAVASLKTWNRASGLMLVGGATSNGKTTTLAHIFKYYLASSGGLGYTIEDPPEYPLQGEHGKTGFCIQTDVRSGEWDKSIHIALRMSPSIIMLGEIRTPAAASEALNAAATGHLVMATIHAGSISEAISRMANLCGAAFDSGGDGHVRKELGAALVGVVHQRLSSYGPDLALLHAETEADRKSVARIIEQRQDGALDDGGWSKLHRAPRLRQAAAK